MTEIELIQSLVNIPQDAIWHPEGNTLIHTNLVISQAIHIGDRDHYNTHDYSLLYRAAMYHDVGKLTTTKIITPLGSFIPEQYDPIIHGAYTKITSYGHAQESARMAREMLTSYNEDPAFIEAVTVLCDTHMNYNIFTPKAVRKLQAKLSKAGTSLALWAALVEADHSGRDPLPHSAPGKSVLELAELCGVPIL